MLKLLMDILYQILFNKDSQIFENDQDNISSQNIKSIEVYQLFENNQEIKSIEVYQL
jgi:hypothetical protein